MITREDIGRYSSELLDLMESEGINSIVSLQRRNGAFFATPEGNIKIYERPRERYPAFRADTIRYTVRGKGVAIEIGISPENQYSTVILKLGESVQGYALFTKDGSGNFVQEKKLGPSLDEVTEELSRLKQ